MKVVLTNDNEQAGEDLRGLALTTKYFNILLFRMPIVKNSWRVDLFVRSRVFLMLSANTRISEVAQTPQNPRIS